MPLRLIEIFLAPGHIDTVAAIAQRFEALDFRKEAAPGDALGACRIVARPEKQQELIDQLQRALATEKHWRIIIMPIEATIPELVVPKTEKRSPEQTMREELYAEIDRGSRLDSTFLLLVLLSTVVATIGLFESSVAIVIAAKLIAPLLAVNLVCVNLSAQLVFLSTGIKPRTWIQRRAAQQSAKISLAISGLLLLLLVAIVYWRQA